jgi:hypothetical protein
MLIGIPIETTPAEARVAMTPGRFHPGRRARADAPKPARSKT